MAAAQPTQQSSSEEAKGILAAVSVAVGVISSIIFGKNTELPILWCLALGLFIAIMYPILGAGAMAISEQELTWAFPKRVKWSPSMKAGFGAVWPGTLLVSTIVSLFYGIVDRLYE